MKQFAFLFVFLLAIAAAACAQTFPNPVDKYVNDFAGILSQGQVNELRALLSGIEDQTTAEITVVIMETTAPDTPSQYRTELFNRWGIGKKGKDNGLLILYAKQERRIEVEVGYGLEGILPDSKVGRILDDHYVPKRDAGNITDGIVDATKVLAQVVLDNAEEVRAGKTTPKEGDDIMTALIIFFVLLIIIAILIAASKSSGKGSDESGYHGGFFGGGSSGGDSGGFGGGGSGGGGAGR